MIYLFEKKTRISFFKLNLLLLMIMISTSVAGQVGIQTTTPNASLDVVALDPNNPTATDGVLIPRVSQLSFAPTAAQNGLLVYLTAPFTASAANGSGKYLVGMHQWDKGLRDGAGDWMFMTPAPMKTASVTGWNSGNIPVSSLTTVGCLSARLTHYSDMRVNVQVRSNCGKQEEANYTFVQGYGTSTVKLVRNRFTPLNGSVWVNLFDISFQDEEIMSGYFYLPTSNKIFRMVISGQSVASSPSAANVILSIQEL